MHKSKHARSKSWWLIFAAACVLFLGGVYLSGAIYFQTHFGFNSTLDDRNIALLDVAQAEERLGLNADIYVLHIIGREDLSLTVDGNEIIMRYVPDGQVATLLKAQDSWSWPTRLLPQEAMQSEPSFTFDADSLNQALNAIGIFDTSTMRPPADAHAVYQDGAYTVRAEDVGTTLDEEATLKAITESIIQGESVCDLNQLQCYVNPSVRTDDPGLQQSITEFNQYAAFQITYTFGEQIEILDANTAITWFDTKSDGSKTLNVERVTAWVKEFAARHDTVGITREFTTAKGEQIQLSGGSFGWEIDQSSERNAIISAIANKAVETRDPIYSHSAKSYNQPDWGNTYVEVDQSLQHLWYFVDGQVQLETDVVTGLPTAKRSTPNGFYYVIEKKSPTKLRGPIIGKTEDGAPKYEWESTVTYWMQVTRGGVGLHDAYWQSSFGLSRWQAGYGSHGCINLPYAKAQELYRALTPGVPVIIHE